MGSLRCYRAGISKYDHSVWIMKQEGTLAVFQWQGLYLYYGEVAERNTGEKWQWQQPGKKHQLAFKPELNFGLLLIKCS